MPEEPTENGGEPVGSPELPPAPYRILSLDGGGAKGFYTLGVLAEIEALAGQPLHKVFDLIFGTSTGAIIASLLAMGRSVAEVHALYLEHVVKVMARWSRGAKSAALERLATDVYGDAHFDTMVTGIGIVSTKWDFERPMIFKAHASQAHGGMASFKPGFGVRVADAVVASCSAYPFFNRKMVTTSDGDTHELVDGGYCANNPTLYAIADALGGSPRSPSSLRVVSVGVGVYPTPRPTPLKLMWYAQRLRSVQLLQKTLEINTQSMDQLRRVLYRDVPTVRVSETFEKPEMATDLFEYDLAKLNMLRRRGRESYRSCETAIAKLIG